MCSGDGDGNNGDVVSDSPSVQLNRAYQTSVWLCRSQILYARTQWTTAWKVWSFGRVNVRWHSACCLLCWYCYRFCRWLSMYCYRCIYSSLVDKCWFHTFSPLSLEFLSCIFFKNNKFATKFPAFQLLSCKLWIFAKYSVHSFETIKLSTILCVWYFQILNVSNFPLSKTQFPIRNLCLSLIRNPILQLISISLQWNMVATWIRTSHKYTEKVYSKIIKNKIPKKILIWWNNAAVTLHKILEANY